MVAGSLHRAANDRRDRLTLSLEITGTDSGFALRTGTLER